MGKPYRFYLVTEDGDVLGTNDLEIALVAKRDGGTLVIEPSTAEATFDNAVQSISAADDADWLEDVGEDDEDGDD